MNEKRIDEIVTHLVGTCLPLHSVMTLRERDNVDFCRMVLSRIKMNGDTMKWEKNVTS